MSVKVAGPIVGGSKGRPFGGPVIDLATRGYRETEFFLEGTATRYRPKNGTEFGLDGHWAVEPAESAPFKTRVVIYRPIDLKAFNGTVLVCWNNVSAGFDAYQVVEDEILEGGFAYAAVTTQRAGIHGFEENPMGLVAWDPERYGSLSILSDDYSFDIFTQAARAVGPDRPRSPVDPLEGLEVAHLIAIGGSQSASRLASYINAVQPLEGVFDALMPFVYFGFGSPIEVGDYVVNIAASPDRGLSRLGTPCRLRDDLDAKVMVVNSEVEAIASHAVSQPDTDNLRIWEVAGTSHISAQAMRARVATLQGAFDPVAWDITGINEVPLNPVTEAAYHHLQHWVKTGTPPPLQPRIEFAGEPPEVVRDENGIAVGGIRLPQVEVPLATNSGIPAPGGAMGLGFLGGSCVPFAPDKIRSLYRDVEDYLERFERATHAAERSGVILARDVEPLIAEARETYERAINRTEVGAP